MEPVREATQDHRASRARRTVVAGAALLGTTVLVPGLLDGAGAARGAPGGNNGTVKVDGEPFENHPGNEPHVGCQFGIDAYGYEAGVPISIRFSLQPPTGRGEIVVIDDVLDDDDASGGGSEAGHDGHFDADLSAALADVAPHPQQGFHVRLTVEVDGGAKHKTFWVSGCDGGSTTSTTTSTSTSTTSTTTSTTSTTTSTTASTTTTTLGES
jgi:hypothetical protein